MIFLSVRARNMVDRATPGAAYEPLLPCPILDKNECFLITPQELRIALHRLVVIAVRIELQKGKEASMV
jgi:hypothetical protein